MPVKQNKSSNSGGSGRSSYFTWNVLTVPVVFFALLVTRHYVCFSHFVAIKSAACIEVLNKWGYFEVFDDILIWKVSKIYASIVITYLHDATCHGTV